ncbi:MAG: hypothetical protein KDA96_02285, partial [Planctomycetaceae bacterium]|nr:hypothetical protein [Planctomycetaceae bacterium]
MKHSLCLLIALACPLLFRAVLADESAPTAMDIGALKKQAERLEKECLELQRQSRMLLGTTAATDAQAAENFESRILSHVEAIFDAQQRLQFARLQLMEARLNEVRGTLTQREQNREELIRELATRFREAGAQHPLLNPGLQPDADS